jgi:hypothetical protein
MTELEMSRFIVIGETGSANVLVVDKLLKTVSEVDPSTLPASEGAKSFGGIEFAMSMDSGDVDQDPSSRWMFVPQS